MRVLIIDDEPVALATAKALIASRGHEVHTRDQALGTTSAMREIRPEVVLVDWRMPGLSGDGLIRLLKRREQADGAPALVVILHSAAPEQELDALAKEVGADGFISKAWPPARFHAEFDRLARR